MKKKLLYAIAFAMIVALLATVGTAFAAPVVKPNLFGPNWRVFERVYLPNGNTNYMMVHPDTIPTGGIQFAIPDQSEAYSNYLLTNYNRDLTGKTIAATIHIDASAGTTFVARGVSPSAPTFVRIEFQDTSEGAYIETDYWWSHAGAAYLTDLTSGAVTITADTTNLADWSDIYGHYANNPAYTAAFHDALAHVKEVTLSFGGGSFFANGVAVASGSATFQLLDFTIS